MRHGIKVKEKIKLAKTINEQYEFLQNQLMKAVFNKYTPATNRKRVDKIAAQMRYLEKMIQPKVREEG